MVSLAVSLVGSKPQELECTVHLFGVFDHFGALLESRNTRNGEIVCHSVRSIEDLSVLVASLIQVVFYPSGLVQSRKVTGSAWL